MPRRDTARANAPAALDGSGGILLGVALVGLANGGLYPIIGLRLGALGFSESAVGLLTSVYFVGTVAGAATGGRIIARIGHVRAFTIFALVAGVATLALGHTDAIPIWAALRFTAGYCMGAYYLVVETLLNLSATNANRGRRLAAYETIRMIAVACSPLLLNIGTGAGSFAFASALFAVAVIPVAALGPDDTRGRDAERSGLARLISTSPLGFLCCLVAGVVFGAFNGLAATFGAAIGLSAAQISFFMMASWLAPVASQVPVGALSDRLGRRPAILLATATGSVAAVAIAGLEAVPLLLGAAVAMGGASHPIYGLGLALTNDCLSPREVVAAGGALLVAYGIGGAAGPTVAAAAMALFGPSGLFLTIAVVLAVLCVLATVSMAGRRA